MAMPLIVAQGAWSNSIRIGLAFGTLNSIILVEIYAVMAGTVCSAEATPLGSILRKEPTHDACPTSFFGFAGTSG